MGGQWRFWTFIVDACDPIEADAFMRENIHQGIISLSSAQFPFPCAAQMHNPQNWDGSLARCWLGQRGGGHVRIQEEKELAGSHKRSVNGRQAGETISARKTHQRSWVGEENKNTLHDITRSEACKILPLRHSSLAKATQGCGHRGWCMNSNLRKENISSLSSLSVLHLSFPQRPLSPPRVFSL